MIERILVVDDSEVNRIIASTNLEEAGYEVTNAASGAEALEFLEIDDPETGSGKKCHFDTILLDVMMPEIDGLEVLEKIRAVWNRMELPVIMATALDEPGDVVEALKKGANDYVTKPLNLEILRARLLTHLDLKANHEALKKAQRALVNAGKMESIGILAAGVAHEIRNPLGRIEMAASGLDSLIDELPEEFREIGQLAAETIQDSVAKADEIVLGLMKASQSQQLDLIEANLNTSIRHTAALFRSAIKEAKIKILFEFDEALPKVLLAEEEFEQALFSILENAIQAMDLGNSERRELWLKTETTTLSGVGKNDGARSGNRLRDGDTVVALHVEDTGPGMAPGDLERVFDAFFTTKATGVGTGLGLTVAGKIIDLHRGLIRLENRESPDTGLRVSIFLKPKGALRTSV